MNSLFFIFYFLFYKNRRVWRGKQEWGAWRGRKVMTRKRGRRPASLALLRCPVLHYILSLGTPDSVLPSIFIFIYKHTLFISNLFFSLYLWCLRLTHAAHEHLQSCSLPFLTYYSCDPLSFPIDSLYYDSVFLFASKSLTIPFHIIVFQMRRWWLCIILYE